MRRNSNCAGDNPTHRDHAQKPRKPARAQSMQKPYSCNPALLCAAGICVGAVNGLFGAGGGILAVVVLERLQGLERDRAHATALIVMLPLSLVSLAVYLLRGALAWDIAPWVALGLVPGSVLGARLLGRLDSIWINRIFCVLMLAAGIRLLL